MIMINLKTKVNKSEQTNLHVFSFIFVKILSMFTTKICIFFFQFVVEKAIEIEVDLEIQKQIVLVCLFSINYSFRSHTIFLA